MAKYDRLWCMTFHESFWILVGTSAPVIALANQVAIGSALDIFVLKGPAMTGASRWSLLTKKAWWTYFIGRMNVGLQAAVLFTSLWCLYDQKNLINPRWAIPAEVDGLLILLPLTTRLTLLRAIQIEQKRSEENTKPVASRARPPAKRRRR